MAHTQGKFSYTSLTVYERALNNFQDQNKWQYEQYEKLENELKLALRT